MQRSLGLSYTLTFSWSAPIWPTCYTAVKDVQAQFLQVPKFNLCSFCATFQEKYQLTMFTLSVIDGLWIANMKII